MLVRFLGSSRECDGELGDEDLRFTVAVHAIEKEPYQT